MVNIFSNNTRFVMIEKHRVQDKIFLFMDNIFQKYKVKIKIERTTEIKFFNSKNLSTLFIFISPYRISWIHGYQLSSLIDSFEEEREIPKFFIDKYIYKKFGSSKPTLYFGYDEY